MIDPEIILAYANIFYKSYIDQLILFIWDSNVNLGLEEAGGVLNGYGSYGSEPGDVL